MDGEPDTTLYIYIYIKLPLNFKYTTIEKKIIAWKVCGVIVLN